MSAPAFMRALALTTSGLLAVAGLGVGSVLALPSPAASAASAAQAAGPDVPAPDWQKYVQGPSSTTVHPVKVLSTTGDVTNAVGALGDGVATLDNPAPPAWPSGTTATGSSTAGANTDNGVPRTYVAANAIDGVTSTFWNDATIGAYPDQLTITSPTAVDVPGVTLLSNSDGVPQDYTVEALVGGSWVTEATVSGNTDLEHAVAFPATVTTTSVRITVTKDQSTGKGEYTRIAELYPGIVHNAGNASITLDFGKVVVGYPKLSFADASAGHPGLRLAFSETTQYLGTTSDFTRSDNGDKITPGTDQVAVPQGPSEWTDTHGCQDGTKVCADGLHGFRYLTITLDALASDAPDTTALGQVKLDDVALDFTGFVGTPDTYTGWFESSDGALNTAWYDAVYTNELITDTFRSDDVDPRNAESASLDGKLVLHDGAKRDRDPYVGDVAVSGLTTYLTHDTARAARNVLADLADHQRADGWIPPASISNYGLQLFDYPLYWVTASWDYLRYTGDRDYATQYYGALQKTLDDFYPSMTDSNGLLSRPSSYGDYAFLGRNGEVTYYNALYVLALQDAAQLATALGHADDAATWTARATSVSDAINAHLWDPKAGAYLDDATGAVRHGQDGNGYAVVAGVANQKRAASALDYLSATTELPYGNAFMDNDTLVGDGSQRVYAFTSFPDIEARFLSGQADSAIDEIKRLYGWMESHDPGTTDWEGIGSGGSMYEGAFTSAAHGWSTGVVPALSNDLLGAQPTGVGFDTWTVQPHPGSVAWAQGALPTPHGDLGVRWSSPGDGAFALEVNAPQGTSGDIAVPVANSTATVTIDGTTVWDGAAVDGSGATLADGYVTLHGVGAGTHELSVTSGLQVALVPGGKVAPGGTAKAIVRVSNPGTGAVRAVSAVLDVAGGLTAKPAAVTADVLEPGDSVDLPFTVTVPAGTAPGDLSATATVTAQIDGQKRTFVVGSTVFATVTAAVTIDPVSVDVGSGDPAQTATVHATVANGAAAPETGRLVVDVPSGWPAPAPSGEVTIAPGGSATLSAAVTIPTSVTAGSVPLTVRFVADDVTLGSASTSANVALADPPASYEDYIDLGDTTSETAHSVTSTGNGGTSSEAGRTRRYSGSKVVGAAFTFTMKVTPNQPFLIRAVETYDRPQTKSYDILVNGTLVASRLNASTKAGLVTYQQLVSDPSLSASGSVQITMRYNGKAAYDPSISDAWTLPVPADTAPPSVELDVSHPGGDGWHLAGAQGTLTASDAGSIASIEYRLAGGAWQTYAGPFDLPAGRTSVDYRATDDAGNVSATAAETVLVDPAAPTVTAAGGSDGAVVAAGQDADSGIDHLEFTAGSGAWYDSLSDALAAGASGALKVRAVDVAGNVSASLPVPVTATPALSLAPGAVRIEASGFAPGAQVPLALAPDGLSLGSPTADAQGVVSAEGVVTGTSGDRTLQFGLTNSAVPTIAGSFEVGSTLSASGGTWNAAASRVGLDYQWLLGGTPISGATGATYTVPVTALGGALSVRVTASVSGASGTASAESAASVVTSGGSTAVRPTEAPVVSGKAAVGGTLTTTTGAWSVPDSSLDFTYQWIANGVPVPGATDASIVVPAGLLGEALGVVVTASVTGGGATGTSPSALATVTAADGSTTVVDRTAPTVTGAGLVGSVLTATPGSWNVPDGALTFTYQWVSDGVAVAGATGATYRVPAQQLGHALGVIVTATLRDGASGSAGSGVATVRATSTTKIHLKRRIASSRRERVRVTVASAAARQAGTVVVKVGKRKYRARVDIHGKAVVMLPRLSAGKHVVKAVYQGAGDVLGSTSASAKVTVVKR